MLTGGGSQIPGLDGLASKILGQQVRLGRPLRVHGLPQAATGPAFASPSGCPVRGTPTRRMVGFRIPPIATRAVAQTRCEVVQRQLVIRNTCAYWPKSRARQEVIRPYLRLFVFLRDAERQQAMVKAIAITERPRGTGIKTGGQHMTLNLSMPGQDDLKPRITVFGVGGAGGNAVNNMIEQAAGWR